MRAARDHGRPVRTDRPATRHAAKQRLDRHLHEQLQKPCQQHHDRQAQPLVELHAEDMTLHRVRHRDPQRDFGRAPLQHVDRLLRLALRCERRIHRPLRHHRAEDARQRLDGPAGELPEPLATRVLTTTHREVAHRRGGQRERVLLRLLLERHRRETLECERQLQCQPLADLLAHPGWNRAQVHAAHGRFGVATLHRLLEVPQQTEGRGVTQWLRRFSRV